MGLHNVAPCPALHTPHSNMMHVALTPLTQTVCQELCQAPGDIGHGVQEFSTVLADMTLDKNRVSNPISLQAALTAAATGSQRFWRYMRASVMYDARFSAA